MCGVDRIDQDTISREHFLHVKLDRIQQQQDLATCSGVRGLMSNDFSRETRILLFFPDLASERKKKIKRLRRERWRVIEIEAELKEHVSSYFFNLLRSAKGHRVNMQ